MRGLASLHATACQGKLHRRGLRHREEALACVSLACCAIRAEVGIFRREPTTTRRWLQNPARFLRPLRVVPPAESYLRRRRATTRADECVCGVCELGDQFDMTGPGSDCSKMAAPRPWCGTPKFVRAWNLSLLYAILIAPAQPHRLEAPGGPQRAVGRAGDSLKGF